MIVPEGFYVIYQPKHRTPGIYDLHSRGLFKTRPFVTSDWGLRVVADDGPSAKLQYLELTQKEAVDAKSGERYPVSVRSSIIDLDLALRPDAKALTAAIPEETRRKEVVALLAEWRDGYVPKQADGKTDRAALEKKLAASLAEAKAALRRNLARKNDVWVQPRLAFEIQMYRRGLHLLADGLHARYTEMGGTEDEIGLIRKIGLFQCLYAVDGPDPRS